jgi:mono/diheme cytochrome c family protein
MMNRQTSDINNFGFRILNFGLKKIRNYQFATRSGLLVVFSFAAILISSCTNDLPQHPGYEFMPDMYRSPSYETNSINTLFADSMTERLPVAGTIPRGNYIPYPYPNTNEGYEAAGKEWKSPLEKNDANLAEGKRLFEIFCIHCHGPEGQGNGSIVANGKFPPPPAYNGPLKDLPEGKMFHTLEYGKNFMGSHASQLTQTERWKIIMYVQTLQKLPSSTTAPADTTKKS